MTQAKSSQRSAGKQRVNSSRSTSSRRSSNVSLSSDHSKSSADAGDQLAAPALANRFSHHCAGCSHVFFCSRQCQRQVLDASIDHQPSLYRAPLHPVRSSDDVHISTAAATAAAAAAAAAGSLSPPRGHAVICGALRKCASLGSAGKLDLQQSSIMRMVLAIIAARVDEVQHHQLSQQGQVYGLAGCETGSCQQHGVLSAQQQQQQQAAFHHVDSVCNVRLRISNLDADTPAGVIASAPPAYLTLPIRYGTASPGMLGHAMSTLSPSSSSSLSSSSSSSAAAASAATASAAMSPLLLPLQSPQAVCTTNADDATGARVCSSDRSISEPEPRAFLGPVPLRFPLMLQRQHHVTSGAPAAAAAVQTVSVTDTRPVDSSSCAHHVADPVSSKPAEQDPIHLAAATATATAARAVLQLEPCWGDVLSLESHTVSWSPDKFDYYS